MLRVTTLALSVVSLSLGGCVESECGEFIYTEEAPVISCEGVVCTVDWVVNPIGLLELGVTSDVEMRDRSELVDGEPSDIGGVDGIETGAMYRLSSQYCGDNSLSLPHTLGDPIPDGVSEETGTSPEALALTPGETYTICLRNDYECCTDRQRVCTEFTVPN